MIRSNVLRSRPPISHKHRRRLPLFGINFRLPFSANFGTYSDGSLPFPWKAPTWAVATGQAYCTPALGSELLTNAGFETGDPPSNWSTWSPVVTRVDDPRTGSGGAKSANLDRNGSDDGSIYQIPTTVANSWYQASTWLRNVDADFAMMILYSNDWTVFSVGEEVAGLAWAKAYANFRAKENLSQVLLYCYAVGLANGVSTRYDDASLKVLTLSSCIAGLPRSLSQDVRVKAEWNIEPLTFAGVVARANSLSAPTSFLLAYHDGYQTVKLDKCVAGTYTSLISATVAYVAGAEIRLDVSGQDADLYYNTIQIGVTQTVADAQIVNNKYHAPFSMCALNLADTFSITQI